MFTWRTRGKIVLDPLGKAVVVHRASLLGRRPGFSGLDSGTVRTNRSNGCRSGAAGSS